MPNLSPAASRVPPSVFSELEGRVAARLRSGGDLVPLQLGDTYLAPPANARFEAHARSDGGADTDLLYKYGSTAGFSPLKAAIAARARSRGLPDVDGERHVHVGVGGTHSLFCAARVLLDNGDDVLAAAPYWPGAPGVFGGCGARVVEVPLSSSAAVSDSPLSAGEHLVQKLTAATRAIYFVSPNNPDGHVMAKDDLESIAEIAKERDLWVFADEVYGDFLFDGREHVSIASLPGMAERTVTLGSFSKSHALAGARVGYAIAPEAVVAAMRKTSVHTAYNVPLIAQKVALAALESGAAWQDEARAIYRAARDAAATALEGSNVPFATAAGGTYLFLDLSRVLAGRTPTDFIGAAVDHGVFLTPGEAFGPSYKSFARLCYTSVPLPRVLEGIARLRSVL